jgi:6-pyruvoyltetrahydropterin/6-carboxytetrahydropterin synthase
MHSISRKFEFDAAHRVYGHESKCANLHGHRYVAWVHVKYREQHDPEKLDNLGRVVDFSVIKDIIGKWIDENWDHNTLLSDQDPLAWWLGPDGDVGNDEAAIPFPSKELYIMDGNPTAENIAKELLLCSNELLKKTSQLYVWKVEVFETPNCSAIYQESEQDELRHQPTKA